ncbi:DJ-1/PfpI family protein [Rhodococcus sp. NPDC003382]
MTGSATRSVSIVLFDGFELLDVFGPVALLSRFPDSVEVLMLGPHEGPVRSSQGTEVVATASYHDAPESDIVMVPGGMGTRSLVRDERFLTWLREWASTATIVTSVCTGSALLAAAGLLNGYRATSNKLAFEWASGHGTDVEWAPRARWVHDRDRWTSSGVAAGMDMTGALLRYLFGREEAERAAREIELELHTDPDRDPFAVAHGLE